MTQLSMFGGLVQPAHDKAREKRNEKLAAKPSIDQRFAEFWQANPHVWAELKRLAFARLEAGSKRIGVKALWEELRARLAKRELAYDSDFEQPPAGGPVYKLNNDFTAMYARKLIQNHPELAAVIEIRRRKGEK